MRDYSVTITLKGRNRSDIKKQLRAAFGASVAKRLKLLISANCSTSTNPVRLMTISVVSTGRTKIC